MKVYAGQRIVSENEFRVSGRPVDPTVVRCYIRHPNGTLTTLVYPSADLVRTAVGLYEAWLTPTVGGTWGVRWEGTGDVEAVTELSVIVEPSTVV